MIEILEPTTDVAVQVNENPALAILNEEKFEAFYEKLKAEAAKVSGDVSTNKARDEVRSMAFKIAKTRTAIDKARLGLTEEWRTKTNQANAAGRAIKERLEALEDQVRKPLTDWEQAEKDREQKHADLLAAITRAEFVGIDDTAESVAELEVERARAEAEKAEQERLERLRQQAVEETKRAAEQARIDQERKHQAELEAERAKVAKAEADRLAEEQRIAAESARVERERIAREQDREHRAKIMGAAKAALMELDIPEDKAREIVLAIAAGNIPAVSIRF